MLKLLRRVESSALLLIIGVAGAVLAFFNIASEVGEGETLAFDRHILLALRNPANLSDPIGSRSFEEAMRDVTALGGVTVMILVTVVATPGLPDAWPPAPRPGAGRHRAAGRRLQRGAQAHLRPAAAGPRAAWQLCLFRQLPERALDHVGRPPS